MKEGREFIIEKEMLSKIVGMAKDFAKEASKGSSSTAANAHRLKHLLECIRNCCFEYEKYEKDFIQMDLLDSLFIILINVQGLATLPDEVSFVFGEHAPQKELFAK